MSAAEHLEEKYAECPGINLARPKFGLCCKRLENFKCNENSVKATFGNEDTCQLAIMLLAFGQNVLQALLKSWPRKESTAGNAKRQDSQSLQSRAVKPLTANGRGWLQPGT